MQKHTFKLAGFALFSALVLTACEQKVAEEATTEAVATSSISGTFTADTENSVVEWFGKKVTGEHNGTVQLADASFSVEDGAVISGNATIDLTTIVVKDIEDAEFNAKLKGHLESPDFFNVAEFPTATLAITGANKGDLTIKGITQPVSFDAIVSEADGKIVVTGSITIDRTAYDIRYGSGKFFENLGDKTINDEFTLKFNVVAK